MLAATRRSHERRSPRPEHRSAPRAHAGDGRKGDNEESTGCRIAARIIRAIEEHRLPPGTKLGEEGLAALFGVGRAHIRHALQALALRRVVTLLPNRGAFVAEPSIVEAREVFAARRLLEPPLAASLVGRIGGRELQQLRRHVAAEDAARIARDRPASIKLSGEFHDLLAALAGNAVVADILRGLIARSSLIIGLYQRIATADCGPDEHRELVDALTAGPARLVARMMDHHLRHVEAGLMLTTPRTGAVDLAEVFGADATN